MRLSVLRIVTKSFLTIASCILPAAACFSLRFRGLDAPRPPCSTPLGTVNLPRCLLPALSFAFVISVFHRKLDLCDARRRSWACTDTSPATLPNATSRPQNDPERLHRLGCPHCRRSQGKILHFWHGRCASLTLLPQNGRLSKWQPADLAGAVIKEAIKRAGISVESTHPKKEGEASIVDDVIVGCVSQVGAQASNVGRMAVLAAGLPESVPGTTVDRQCGSSQQAVHFAAQAVMSGVQDIVVAAGVENMSLVPIGASVVDGIKAGHGKVEDAKGLAERYPGILFSQFEGAELVASTYGITRKDMEELAVASHARAVQATKEGRFKKEILPLMGVNRGFPLSRVHVIGF